MDDVEDDRAGEQDARHPVPVDPRELDADDRQEGREHEHQHREGHHPVEHPGDERVARNGRRQSRHRRFHAVHLAGFTLVMRREQHVAAVGDEEQDAAHERGPEQIPRDADEDRSRPTGCSAQLTNSMHPLLEWRASPGPSSAASCRRCGAAAPRPARPARRPARPSARRVPCRAGTLSTASSRYGRAETPFTTSRASLMLLPDALIAEAMLTSAKSHTCRSRTFSK